MEQLGKIIKARIQQRQEIQTAVAKRNSTKFLPNAELKTLFLEAAQTQTPPNRPYYVLDQNKEVLNQLLYYFNSDETFSGDFNKGIMLRGNVGSGKSCFMRIFQLMNLKPLIYKPCKDVAAEYSEGGFKEIRKYGKGSIRFFGERKELVTFCFDDLGTEYNSKFYGNESNVMADIIHERYELFKTEGLLTHFTTNLTRTETKEKYGDRILSRLEEMCNFITLGNGADSIDFRTYAGK